MWGRAAIQWISRTHKRTTLSSSEADYVAMAEGFKEALFLRSVWRFFLPEFGDPCIQVYEDTNRFSWRSTLSRTRTRSTSTCVTTSCENMSRAESLKSCTHKVLARRFLDETPCQGRLPFSQELHWFFTESLVLSFFLRLGDTGTLHTCMMRRFVLFLWRHEILILHSFRPYLTQLMTVGPGRLSAICWGDVGVKSILIFESEIWKCLFIFWDLISEIWFLNSSLFVLFSFLTLRPENWFWIECDILIFVLGLWVW